MANCVHSYVSCPLWSVSVGARICCQNCSSASGRGVMRLQSFEVQGTGWKLASFLQWPSNVVTALANGARQGMSQAGSLSGFSLPCLTLSLPWLMELCRGESGQTGGSNRLQARFACRFRGKAYQQNFKR